MSTGKPKTLKSRVKEFWLNYETKIVLIIGFILVAAVSFEAGILKGQKWEQKPLIIEKPAQVSENSTIKTDSPTGGDTQKVEDQAAAQATQNTPSQTQNSALENAKTSDSTNVPSAACAFVGSKNSTSTIYQVASGQCG